MAQSPPREMLNEAAPASPVRPSPRRGTRGTARAAPGTSWLLGLLLLVLAWPAGAVQVPDLYTAQVPVSGQAVAERNRAIAAAFRKVLVKVTGSREPLGGGDIGGDLGTFVQQYRYLVDEPEAGEAAEGAEGEPQRRLRVQFDKKAVDGWIRDRGLSIWGANRPGVLLWLGLERDGRRRLFVPETDPSIAALLKDAAGDRGLILTLPLMDLQDRGLQPSDLWGGFTDSIREASLRYGPDATLAARVSARDGGRWDGRWTLIQGERSEQWSTQGASLEEVLRQGVGRTADVLAAQFVPDQGGEGLRQVALRVDGVRGFADYARLRRHLDSLEMLGSADLHSVRPQTLIFVLGVRGDQGSFAQSLGLGGVIRPTGRAPGMPGELPAGRPAALPDAPLLEYRMGP